MKLLLTSAGIKNTSIHDALVDLLPKPIAESDMANAERWAAGLPNPAYAIDDETAITVVDDTVEGVSEGHWTLFTPGDGVAS